MKRFIPYFLLAVSLVSQACGRTPNSQISESATASVSGERVRTQYAQIANQTSGHEKSTLTARERETLFNRVSQNPVANLDMVNHYDPQALTGFCFGRSMTAHLEARRMGLKSESIKKMFIVGDLRQRGSQKTEWRFHVTTVVEGQDGIWYAIDPIFERVMPMLSWIKETRDIWDTWHLDEAAVNGPQSKIYVVDADSVLPDIRDFRTVETGNYIIELKFSPEGRSGFSQDSALGERAYRLSKDASEAFFLSSLEANAADRFDFMGLKFVDGLYIVYNNYFVDLMNSLTPVAVPEVGVVALVSRDSATMVVRASSTAAPRPDAAGISFDFEAIQSLRNARN